MNIAFCYESVLPARGGCETYINDLARRLLADKHEVHLYASRWDEEALPQGIQVQRIRPVGGPRFLRPWRFGARCLEALAQNRHDVTLGFDKTWGQDVLYPQGGLHAASAAYNLNKHPRAWQRLLARLVKGLDVAHWSFSRLERRQYLGPNRPLIVVNSFMVREHFQRYYDIPSQDLFVVRSAIDPGRFPEHDRLKRRQEWRDRLGATPIDVVGLFAAMNYRLKGLDPLLHAVERLVHRSEFRQRAPAFLLMVVGNPNFRKYEKLADALGISRHVRFVGHCPQMRNAYFAADFLVHPTFYDPCSLVVLEGLSCGLPVITTRANGAGELLHPPQEGYVIPDPHDHEHLAWCMLQLMDPGRRAACSQAARRAASSWTLEQHYHDLLQVFSEAAARKQAA